MKKYFFIALMLSLNIFAQNPNFIYDQHFIKADNVEAYEELIKEKFLPYNQARKNKGIIEEFTVWRVIHNPDEDFTHMVTFIYDISKENSNDDFNALKEINTSEKDWERFQNDASNIRKLVYRHKWNNLKSISKKGVDLPSNIMVLNFMKLKNDKYGSYEQAEVKLNKSISSNSPREGWTLHRRLDNYGTDTYYSHTTIDWYDNYLDFIKTGIGGVAQSDPDKESVNMNNLRDLKQRVIMYKAFQSK